MRARRKGTKKDVSRKGKEGSRMLCLSDYRRRSRGGFKGFSVRKEDGYVCAGYRQRRRDEVLRGAAEEAMVK